MICTTREINNTLEHLALNKFILVVDQDDNEYVIDSVVKRKLYSDDDKEWCYVLKVHEVLGNGYIKR